MNDINIVKFYPTKKKEIKKELSKWFVTIQTNIRPKTEIDAINISEELDNVIQSIFSDRENLEYVLEFLDGGTSDDVDEVNVAYDVELGGDWVEKSLYQKKKGGKGGRVHSHITLEIFHYTKLKLDFQKIKEKVVELMPSAKNPYINVRIDRASISQHNQERYLSKYQSIL